MTVIDINARTEEFVVNENRVTVYSHASLTEPDQHVVQLFVGQTEIAMVAPTRADAIVELAEFLKATAVKLRMMAFEQEGATGLTVGDLSGSKPR